MGELCAKNQWSEGGPVIMVQIENGEFHFQIQARVLSWVRYSWRVHVKI